MNSMKALADAFLELEAFIANELDPNPAPIVDYLTGDRRKAVETLLKDYR